MIRIRAIHLALLLMGVLAPLAAHAESDTPAKCTLVEVLASYKKPKGGVDPKIPAAVRGSLPTDQGDTFEFLAQRAVAAARGKPVSAKLANGDALELTYKERIAGDGKARLRMGGRLIDASGRLAVESTIVIEDGAFIIYGGSIHKHGKLVVALSCTL